MKSDKVPATGTNSFEVEEVRHTTKCRICKNPRRALIERDFVLWRNPQEIVGEYGLSSFSAVYIHARAMGLAAQRNENARIVLNCAGAGDEFATVGGDTAIRGGREYRWLDDKGHWKVLPKNVMYESPRVPEQESMPANEDSGPAAAAASSGEPKAAEFLIADAGLENAASR